MKHISHERFNLLNEYSKIIDNLEKRLINKNASLDNILINGKDRAILLEIERINNELKKDLIFLEKHYKREYLN
jgi:hypothetical protein